VDGVGGGEGEGFFVADVAGGDFADEEGFVCGDIRLDAQGDEVVFSKSEVVGEVTGKVEGSGFAVFFGLCEGGESKFGDVVPRAGVVELEVGVGSLRFGGGGLKVECWLRSHVADLIFGLGQSVFGVGLGGGELMD